MLSPKKNELQKKDVKTDVSIFQKDKGDTGFEHTDSSTYKTPFLKILQDLSPEIKQSSPSRIPGAQVGQFCNTATQEVSDTMHIIVLKVEHSLIAWKPNRGGFAGRYPKHMESIVVDEKDGLKKWDKDGNELMDTIELFCLDAENPSSVFIFPLSGASVKHARSFATRLRMLRCDGEVVGVSWAGIWKISTVEERNDQGTWFTVGSTPEFIRFVTEEEISKFIKPAKEMLKTAETDYSIIESSSEDSEDEEVSY